MSSASTTWKKDKFREEDKVAYIELCRGVFGDSF